MHKTNRSVAERLEAAEVDLLRLASFPERDPNPVIETDPEGRLAYQNPAARALFPDLAERGRAHPWLAGLPAAVEQIIRTGAQQIQREVTLGGATYEQALSHIEETGLIRIYGRDVTARQRGEEDVRRKNAVLNGINTIFRSALGRATEEELGRACLEVAKQLTGSRFGFIGEIGSDGLLHSIAISDPGWESCAMYDQTGRRRPPGNFKLHGVYGRVLLEGRSFFTNDPPSHPDSVGTPAGHPALASFLGVPLFRDGRTIGMIALANREGGYGAGELQSVEALAPAVVEALQRLRAERALSRSEKRLEQAQAIAHLGSWELDLLGKVLTWSDEVYRIFGLEPQQFGATYEAFLEAVHPEDRAAVDAAYADSVRAGTDSYEIEHRIVRRPSGEVRFVHEKCEHFRDDSGRIIRSIGMVHDITERREAQAALQQSLQRFELLAQIGGELLQAPEIRETIERICRRVTQYLHCHAFFNFLVDEETGKLRLNVCTGTAEEQARRAVAEDLPSAPDVQTRLAKACGLKAFASHPMLGPEGGVLGTLSFGARDRESFTDGELSMMKVVTDLVAMAVTRMRVAKRMRRMVKELSRSNQDLEQFAYVASHDMQEPLRAVTGFLELLKSRYQGQLDAKADTWILHAVDGARRMSALIDDLLAYSRVDRQDPKPVCTSAQGALNSALDNLRSSIAETGAIISHDDLPSVWMDSLQLVLLFQNLIGNAVKFRCAGRRCEIHVGACREGSRWVLSVRDNGIGIPAKQFDRIFLVFQRLHSRGKYPGTGIGLAICKKIVERHGGRIWVESVLGEGSTICFALRDGTENSRE